MWTTEEDKAKKMLLKNIVRDLRKISRKRVPLRRSSMIERSTSDFETRLIKRLTKCDEG